MNNDDFEQQFTQTVKTLATEHPPVVEREPISPKPSSNSKLLIIAIIVLSIILLVESIALIITLNNYFSNMEYEYVEEDLGEATEIPDSNYVWDEEGNLVAFDISCTSGNGSRYVLNKDGKYQEYDNSSTLVDLGTYTIINNGIIPLTSTRTTEEKVIYYDGFDLAHNTTIYHCEEGSVKDNTESNS
ncbi:MAG: hypothetical protein Q4F56_00085 [Candidatus Saccharibacteria bacterium]|nr:hypothetical protein [Candidatus Saccharibacteria bacterium]